MNKWDANFMQKRRHLHWRAEKIVEAIDSVLHPKSVLDVGCATGDLIAAFLRKRIPAHGVDISPAAIEFADPEISSEIFIVDMTQDQTKSRFLFQQDLVMAVEFFSVIEPRLHDMALNNMLVVCQRWLLICCGEEKRFGLKEKVLDRGLKLKEDAVYRIRTLIEPYKKKLAFKAFYNGLMVFERR
jgi:SAM-dependent methyltransferase